MDNRRVISSQAVRVLLTLWFLLYTFTIAFPLIAIPSWVLGIVGILIVIALVGGW